MEHYEVYMRDIDPDSGAITTNHPIALVNREAYANIICKSLNKYNDEPNRDFYYKRLEKSKL
jgi:hypothetical protein